MLLRLLGGTDPFIFNLGLRWKLMVNVPAGKNPRHPVGGWLDGLQKREKRKIYIFCIVHHDIYTCE
jgi:hypothetical protein